MKSNFKQYQKKMQDQLREWSSLIGLMEARAGKSKTEAKHDLNTEIDQLKKLEAAAKRHAAFVESVAAKTWYAPMTDLTDRWKDLSGAFDAMWARIHGFSPTAGAVRTAISISPRESGGEQPARLDHVAHA